MTIVAFLFSGLPVPVTVLFIVALCIVLIGHFWATVLFIAGGGAAMRAPKPQEGLADDWLWIFVVPALNEEITIADSVERLVAAKAKNRVILVINDGSSDRTPDILAELNAPDLSVLTRTLPEARQGKSAALNAAWRHIGDEVLATGKYAGWARERCAVVVVDADGRLDPNATDFLAAHLANDRVGGVQLGVRIYNRDDPLTWMQDIEFGVYGGLYQMGRTRWGTAGMGGNGQCNRLTALDSVAGPEGPWRDRLTEDQDVGFRLLEGGWLGVHDSRATIDQQGLSGMARLYRQRTRWAQGNMQAMGHLRSLGRIRCGFVAKLELIWYLLQPPLQAVVGLSTITALVMAIGFGTPFISSNDQWGWLWLLVLFLLAFGGTGLGCLTIGRGNGIGGYLRGLVTAIPYAFYSWLLWPVIVRATWRQLRHSTGWAKTPRESISNDDAPVDH